MKDVWVEGLVWTVFTVGMASAFAWSVLFAVGREPSAYTAITIGSSFVATVGMSRLWGKSLVPSQEE